MFHRFSKMSSREPSVSESQEQGVMSSSGHTSALGMQSSSVPVRGMTSLSQTVLFTSSLPQTTMSPSIKTSQILQQTRSYNPNVCSMSSGQTQTWQNQTFQYNQYNNDPFMDQQAGQETGSYQPQRFQGYYDPLFQQGQEILRRNPEKLAENYFLNQSHYLSQGTYSSPPIATSILQSVPQGAYQQVPQINVTGNIPLNLSVNSTELTLQQTGAQLQVQNPVIPQIMDSRIYGGTRTLNVPAWCLEQQHPQLLPQSLPPHPSHPVHPGCELLHHLGSHHRVQISFNQRYLQNVSSPVYHRPPPSQQQPLQAIHTHPTPLLRSSSFIPPASSLQLEQGQQIENSRHSEFCTPAAEVLGSFITLIFTTKCQQLNSYFLLSYFF